MSTEISSDPQIELWTSDCEEACIENCNIPSEVKDSEDLTIECKGGRFTGKFTDVFLMKDTVLMYFYCI